MGEPGRLRLHLLGRFAAEVDGESPRNVEMSGKLRRALLAYIGMQPSLAETRERLASLLWGESPDRQARQNLRQCLLDLRRDFEAVGLDPLIVDRTTIALDPRLIAVDAREFLTLCDSDDLADLEKAIGLYDGPLLDGLDLDIEAFRDWLSKERARLEPVAVLAFEKYVLRQDGAGNGSQAIRAAERLVGLDPLRESAQRLLIGVLARHSGRSVALAQAATLTAMLRAELDAEPEPETAALIDEIKASVAPAALPVAARRASAETGGGLVDENPSVVSSPDSKFARPRTAFSRPFAWSAAAASAVALSVLAFVLFGRDQVTPQPGNTSAAPVVAAGPQPDPPPRSPSIMPGVTVDKAALAALGFSAVVVLPFTTADAPDGAADKGVADRLTDDLINDLARIPPLRVIARQTSRLYGGKSVDVAAIGAELGVRYVVEGNVQFQKPNLRVNVSLVDATTRLQVWSDRFDRDYAEESKVQDEIVRGIARALHLTVLANEDRRRPPASPQKAGIDELLSKGWYAMANNSVLDITAGPARYFGEVLGRDSDNVSAMIGLGGYHVVLVDRFLVAEPGDHLDLAEELLRKAIKRNPQSVMSYYFLGVLHRLRGQRPEALAAFGKALEHNPSLPLAYAQSGDVLAHMGKLDEAMDHVLYAIRLSPKDPSLGLFSLFAGKIELERGNNAAAIGWFKRAVTLAPRSALNHAFLAASLALQEEKAASAKSAAAARGIAPWLTYERMAKRVVDETEEGLQPRRLIEGLQKAFDDPS
jgi:TolB-like protein/DNA-binding SARP family transcriptional activator